MDSAVQVTIRRNLKHNELIQCKRASAFLGYHEAGNALLALPGTDDKAFASSGGATVAVGARNTQTADLGKQWIMQGANMTEGRWESWVIDGTPSHGVVEYHRIPREITVFELMVNQRQRTQGNSSSRSEGNMSDEQSLRDVEQSGIFGDNRHRLLISTAVVRQDRDAEMDPFRAH